MVLKRRRKAVKRKGKRRGKVGRVRKGGYKMFNVGTRLGGAHSYPFPPAVRTKLKMRSVSVINAISGAQGTANAYELQYTGNTLIPCGPRVNYPLGTAGPLGDNEPQALFYLLSTNNLDASSNGIYSRYCVYGSSINLNMCIQTQSGVTNNPSPIGAIVVPVPFGWVLDSMTNTNLMEMPNARYIQIPQQQTNRGQQITSHMTYKNVFGKHPSPNDLTTTGTVDTTPSHQFNWYIRFFNTDGSSQPYKITLTVTIIYDSYFFDRNILTSATPTLSQGFIQMPGLTPELAGSPGQLTIFNPGPSGVTEGTIDAFRSLSGPTGPTDYDYFQ